MRMHTSLSNSPSTGNYWINGQNCVVRVSVKAVSIDQSGTHKTTRRLYRSVTKLAEQITEHGLSTVTVLKTRICTRGYEFEAIVVPFASQFNPEGYTRHQLAVQLNRVLWTSIYPQMASPFRITGDDIVPKHELYGTAA